MDHFGTFSIANDANVVDQPGFTSPEIDLNGHGSYTAMLLDESPVRNLLGDINFNAPYPRDDPSLDINNTYDEGWLSLALPEPDVEVSDTPMNVELNQNPVESSGPGIDFPSNNRLFTHSEVPPDVVRSEMILDPMPINELPPRTLEFEFGGRAIQATPVELNTRASTWPRNIIEPIPFNGSILHNVGNSLYFLRILITKGAEAMVVNRDVPFIKSGEYIQLRSLTDGRNDIWERDHLMNQNREFLISRYQGPPQVIYVSTFDDEEESEDDEENNDMINQNHGNFRAHVTNRRSTVGDIGAIASEIDNLSYEEIIAIQDQIGYVNAGLPERRIVEAVKIVHFLGSDPPSSSSSSPSLQCSICWDGYEDGQDIGILKCEHEFHYDCIKHWLVDKNSCPLCRKNAF